MRKFYSHSLTIIIYLAPARTVAGIVRSLVGESFGVDWREYTNNPDYVINSVKLRDVIGYSDDLGQLKFRGHCQQRYFRSSISALNASQSTYCHKQ